MDSYDTILRRMKDKYEELTGNSVPELSDIDIRMKVLAGELYNDEVNLEYIKRQMFAQSATGESLDRHANDRGLARKEAVKSKGRVRFSIPQASELDITIPRGTIVATEGTPSATFVTDENAVIEAGETMVTVDCTAQTAGRASNVAIGKISVIVTTVSGVESVTNPASFKGGADREPDENLRKRILDSYKSISNGTNKAYYKKLALSVSGVSDANVVPRVRGIGTVDVYIYSSPNTADGELIARVQRLMDENREINVNVKVYAAWSFAFDIEVCISVQEGYEFNTVSQAVEKALSDYISSLSVGDSVLATHLGRVILSVEGVYDYSWALGAEPNYNLTHGAYPKLGSITVQEMSR